MERAIDFPGQKVPVLNISENFMCSSSPLVASFKPAFPAFSELKELSGIPELRSVD